jgi:RNA polymerase sigma factor (sigma-70 family)
MSDRRIREAYIYDLSSQHRRLDDETVRLLHSRLLATGDKNASDALTLHLMPMVLKLAGELQIPDKFMDDAIQAGNLALLKYMMSWNATKGQSISTYLYPAVRSDMLRELDDLQSCGVLSREWDNRAYVESSEETVEAVNEHNEKLEDVVLIQQLRKAINVLDEPDRAVMLLIADDKSHQEVADTLSIPRRTVSRIVKRATGRLSSILK